MYVCICNAVTDQEIRAAYAEGAHTFAAIQDELGVATCCGCCEPVAREVLASCRAEQEQEKATLYPLPALTVTAAAVVG